LTDVDKNIFIKFLNELKKNFWKKLKVNKKIFKKNCYKFYKDKTYERVGLAIKRNPKVDKVHTVNGKKISSIYRLLAKVDWEELSEGYPVNFHGDMQPENIIVTKKNNFKFIDWRTDFSGLEYGDIYYDLSKLNHMLSINTKKVLEGKIKIEYKNKHEVKYYFEARKSLLNFQNLLYQFIEKNNYKLKKVKLITALIYLNISKFYDYPYSELLFYHGKYQLHMLTK
jgi:thiamine kinase-like enzyme